MRISDWSSDVCSSDLADRCACPGRGRRLVWIGSAGGRKGETHDDTDISCRRSCAGAHGYPDDPVRCGRHRHHWRSEEHTSELQSLMRISYAVFCLKKKKKKTSIQIDDQHEQKTNKEATHRIKRTRKDK